MKLILLFLILVTGILAGCTQAGQGPNCPAPYRVNGAGCCLDKNTNQICDADETAKITTIIKERPVLTYNEICDATSRFECVEKRITKNGVTLKLRLAKDELVQVRSVELSGLGCTQEFAQPVMQYNDLTVLQIPCVVNQGNIQSKMAITADIQQYLRYSNGQAYGTTEQRRFTLSGLISGFVQA